MRCFCCYLLSNVSRNIHFQVIKFDQDKIDILKSEDTFLDPLQAVSPEVKLSIPVKPSKPIHCKASIPKSKGMRRRVRPAISSRKHSITGKECKKTGRCSI